jgi:hypothetical protein
MNKIEIFYSLFKTTPKQSINPSIHQSMSYMLLLEVLSLPNEIIDIIYEFMKVNAVNALRNHFKNAKERHEAFYKLSHYSFEYISINTIYSIYSINNSNFHIINSNFKDKVIEDIYKYLIIMHKSHYPRVKYLRHHWANALGNISQILMHYYNRLAFSDSLKKKNINYIYLTESIQLWFKLCQKYNLYLVLCYMKSAKKVDRNSKAIKLRTIKNFAEFRLAPLVTYDKMPEDSIRNERGIIPNHKQLRFNAYERSIY